MKLYHGTNVEFNEIDLSKCLPFKDFGQGFYLTCIKSQAERMAQRKSHRFGNPILLCYEVDDNVVNGLSDCNVKIFNAPDQEWAEFILANRQKRETPFQHPFDIVIGPVADDGVAYVLNRYTEGAYTIDEVVEKLKYAQLNSQYYFGIQKAINHLKLIEK